MIKIPVTAVVVSSNEAHLLKDCLTPLKFCEKVIVVDLDSKDNTKKVAEECGAVVFFHKKVPLVEMVHNWIKEKIFTKWILITDPDEVFSPEVCEDIVNYFNKYNDSYSAFKVPIQYYFKRKKLNGGIWGGIKYRYGLLDKTKFSFESSVHVGKRSIESVKEFTIPFTGKNLINHYWMSGFEEFIEKHKRYLQYEGKAKYANNIRYNIRDHLYVLRVSFWESFFKKKGYKDGFVGFFLSLLWMWYQVMTWYSLLRYEKSQKN